MGAEVLSKRRLGSAVATVLLAVALSAVACASAPLAVPKLDEATVRSIVGEIVEAFGQRDLDVVKAYLYPGTTIVLDLDPTGGTEPVKIDHDRYLFMLEMGMGVLEDSDIQHEILKVEMNDSSNTALVEGRATTVADILGVRVHEETISKTTYGIVNGEIKVLSIFSRVLSLNVEEE